MNVCTCMYVMYTFWSSTTGTVYSYSTRCTPVPVHTHVYPSFKNSTSTRVTVVPECTGTYLFIFFIKKPSKLCRRIPLVIVMCGTQSFLSSLNRTTAQETLSNRPPPPPIIACSCSVACGHLAPNRPTTNPSLPHSHKRR